MLSSQLSYWNSKIKELKTNKQATLPKNRCSAVPPAGKCCPDHIECAQTQPSSSRECWGLEWRVETGACPGTLPKAQERNYHQPETPPLALVHNDKNWKTNTQAEIRWTFISGGGVFTTRPACFNRTILTCSKCHMHMKQHQKLQEG